jgi:hypothetical protein
MSPEGRENFMYKWKQVIGSIQKTNDLDVHMALITAPTYATEIKNKYYSRTKTPHQMIREHIDMFGFMQKNVNAMDILIEVREYSSCTCNATWKQKSYYLPTYTYAHMYKNAGCKDYLADVGFTGSHLYAGKFQANLPDDHDSREDQFYYPRL